MSCYEVKVYTVQVSLSWYTLSHLKWIKAHFDQPNGGNYQGILKKRKGNFRVREYIYCSFLPNHPVIT